MAPAARSFSRCVRACFYAVFCLRGCGKDGPDWLGESMSVEPIGKMVGRLGELLVEQQLIERGWHPVRLDTAQMASNADLLAIKGKYRVSLQVKTTNAKSEHSHSQSLSFGYATGYLRDHKPIFNSKSGPLLADAIVGVSYGSPTRFVVMPVAFAEKLCQKHCDYWFEVPKKSSEIRSPRFPSICPLRRRAVRTHNTTRK